MNAPIEIDLWFSAGSTYTYLTMMRLPQVEAETGARFRLRPIYLGAIFQEIGRRPFLEEPQKTAYMWRDIERRAARLGLSPQLPAPYPAPDPVLANKLIQVAIENGYGRGYIDASYRAWFEQGHPIATEPNISLSMRAAGQDPEEALRQAAEPRIHETLQAETRRASELGIFGSPTFAVDGELFWGDDRMEEAVDWARSRS